MKITYSTHAKYELKRRQLSEKIVKNVVENPQQIIRSPTERLIYQSKYIDTMVGKEMLLRIVVEKRKDELFVITCYKTSKIGKYWQTEGKE